MTAAAVQHGRWPRQRVPWGDSHLPPAIRAALAAGLFRRELFVYAGRSISTINAGGAEAVRIQTSEEAHFELVMLTSDTRSSFRVQLALEEPLPNDETRLIPLASDDVAAASLFGTGSQPRWMQPLFVPASWAILARAQNVSTSAQSFNVYFIGCRLVR